MKMIFNSRVCIGLAVSAMFASYSGMAAAQQAGEGWYVGAGAFYSDLKDADNRDRRLNTSCDPILGCSRFITEQRYKSSFDSDTSGGITIGYDYRGPFRAEVELRYFENDVDKLKFNDGTVTSSRDSVKTRSLMFNFWYDFMNHSRLRPYVGGGVGVARLDFGNVDDDVPVAQAGAGLSFNLTDRFTVDAGYRYSISSSPVYSSSTRAVKSDYEVEHFMLGIRYNFFEGRTGLRDSDGDGVADRFDRCPGTPRGVQVDSQGCPVDSDGDGVPDYLDKCPGTPAGTRVDITGCPIE